MSVQDIELRYVERTVVREPAHGCIGVSSITLHVLQWRKLVRENSTVALIDTWTPWQDVPTVKEDAS